RPAQDAGSPLRPAGPRRPTPSRDNPQISPLFNDLQPPVRMAHRLHRARAMAASDPDLKVVREVLSYFVRNPQAAASLEGIARWRLLDEIVTRSVEQTRSALSWLVDHGYLCVRTGAGSGPIFTQNTAMADEARALLASPASDSEDE